MEQPKKKSLIRDLLESLGIALLIALPIKFFIASPFIVRQTSMFPTFKDGDYLIVDKVTYRFNEPERGDVVVFHPPFSEDTYFIKRIIGLPGETVLIDNNKITIINNDNPNGFTLDEPYISSERDLTLKTELSNNKYFVMGDNRSVSSDSRNWGPLEFKDISGRAIFRLFPFTNIDYMPGSTHK